MDTRTPSMRVLVRPTSTPPLPPNPRPSPTPPEPTSASPQAGITVVGFVGKCREDVALLINKIIDSNVFGSGNLERSFPFEGGDSNPEIDKWFRTRRLSFYLNKGILYLQFSTSSFPLTSQEVLETRPALVSVFEDHELGDLQGLLFMFSVCHVIILIEEGSRFDTQFLKKFRLLQTAKQSIAPFIRSQNELPQTSRSHSSASITVNAFGTPMNNPSPGKSRGILKRNASTSTLMSGLGSSTSLLPGQCTPVVLFAFLDDFDDIQHSSKMEEPAEASSLNLSNSSNMARPSLPMKGSSSVVVLARPANKSEGGVRKKMQTSLEAQIRFSIKKCRTLSGSESGHTGSRRGETFSSAPLFSVDASKAVSLVDFRSIQSGESLEFAIGLVEEVLDGKETSDSLLLENHKQYASKDDILSLKEFIHKQCELLRGRGNSVTSTNTGTSAGGGMVAVVAAAAAAAAASGKTINALAAAAASGKTINALELPSFEIWLSSSMLILRGILSAKRSHMYETEINRTAQQDASASNPLESAISHIESVTALNSRFSNVWCQKAFPVAKKVYLDELPNCYPSSQHEDHLKKALAAFSSMVKGPGVQLYMDKLKDECTSIWSCGRQLCDAVSLTGKPCMHQKHDQTTPLSDVRKPHSSGFVYLHACACGRSRQLRPDPFDYETANVTYNFLADCDKLLPAVQLPEQSIKGPIRTSSWNLIRIGSAKYYDPSKGLLQSGFRAAQKFLLRWTIFHEKLIESDYSMPKDFQKVSLDSNIKFETGMRGATKTFDGAQSLLSVGQIHNDLGIQIGHSSDMMDTGSRNTVIGRGLFNFTMKKPFSEVVSGSTTAHSGFPPLFSRKQPIPDPTKVVQKHDSGYRGQGNIGGSLYNVELPTSENVDSVNKTLDFSGIASGGQEYSPFSHVDSNDGQIRSSSSIDHVMAYVGFEHECPHGHRFILTPDHLVDPISSGTVQEENVVQSSMGKSGQKQDSAKHGKSFGHGKTRRQMNGIIIGGGTGGKGKTIEKSREQVANGNKYASKVMQSSKPHKEQYNGMNVVKDLDTFVQSTPIDGDCAFSLINRSLPIYMNCPYCRDSTTQNDASNVKFAGTVSQLQRIFVVSCLPPSVPDRDQKLQFSLGCPVILPPDSFLSLRLPFVYGLELDGGILHSLKPSEYQPELTAWITKGTTLQVVSDKKS
ncbi:hypothetical protein F511_23462 [Dorcoceras hygrometricum]|uniref:Nonsense-mediated mRNA decay factor SMG8 n=1 Tax=Dorcoceras hygrometricum TaxID=472368 RepID=A0A2Z7C505_9LAMI|nr:hypothetical protein F511_23462 [Dorcoceras hygrometricum]